jgi:hypothetical protein
MRSSITLMVVAGDEGFEVFPGGLSTLSDGPLTDVMLVLEGRTRVWILGRVAVNFGRQVLPPQGVRNPREVWPFVTSWLNRTIEEAS